MRILIKLSLLGLLVAGPAVAHQSATATAPQPDVTNLLTKIMADNPDKELLMLVVDYPPGAIEPVHRHDAQAFVYVLEGSIVMGVRGDKSVTLVPGQTFYEGPHDVHTIGRNASLTRPAKFLVFLLKNRNEPVASPAN